MKKIAVVPTLLTLGNGVCGFAAITWASKIPTLGDAIEGGIRNEIKIDECFALAGWFLIFAMLFDMLDGYVARLSKTASKFGGELDSLCDAISFGIAPAFMLLKMGPDWDRALLHQVLAGIAGLYMVCTILRLARFNVDNTPDPAGHKRFRGLPSPGAAGCIASLAIFRGEFPTNPILSRLWDIDVATWRERVSHFVEIAAPIGALVVALLMVSRVPYPHVTKQILRGRRNLAHLIQVLIAALVIMLVRNLALVVIFWSYALLFPIRGMMMARNAPSPQQHHVDDPPRGGP